MCGIVGYLQKNGQPSYHQTLTKAAVCLNKRGPDAQQVKQVSANVWLAHARLSIIDTSSIANQPMSDPSGRYTIVFNGEIFNYRELRTEYLQGHPFVSTSDTEVLLYLYMKLGVGCLNLLNGFFAFAIHDAQTNQTFIARDRYGIKPLHIFSDERMVVFASEVKAIVEFPIARKLNSSTLALYLQLNYIPDNIGMLHGMQRLKPGHYAVLQPNGVLNIQQYYTIPYVPGTHIQPASSYENAQLTLKKLIEEAVQRRLVSDVPLGSFLSGGIDSSIVTACAARHVRQLNTFSIGYKDETYFDETMYANLVAKKFGTNHTVFSVSNDEMFEHIHDILNYIDEPFADSSAIAVYILSKKTRQRVTVALSGDGGDELFAGYNKHRAEVLMLKGGLLNALLKPIAPLAAVLPQSRHGSVGNLFRKIHRYVGAMGITPAERYWRWCSLLPKDKAIELINNLTDVSKKEAAARMHEIMNAVKNNGEINDVLYADMQMVLSGDMLAKVDLMSMANSLEVRVPLLDYTVVDYAFSLPANYKNDGNVGKKVLKDAFRNILPQELFNRPKHGFEVPLRKWLTGGLRSLVEKDLLSKEYISAQGIFNLESVEGLKKQLYSSNPGDTHATIWALVVFQHWYKNNFEL